MRCVIYARYSSDLQREASIEDQVRICRARAERDGWEITTILTDYAVSGATTLRPGYQQLMALLRGGGTDIVLAESLDRLSRDQEHLAALYKLASFAGVDIFTVADDKINDMHVGLKGTLGAIFLKDLADKTRRGLEGRVRQGRSGGGLSYGYRVIRGVVGSGGEMERGLREIDIAQAEVIRRVFEEFAAGSGPKTIAAGLNRDAIAGPRGGHWTAGAIRGQVARDTGMLRNRLYIGELVWNQRRWIKDPASGRRVARDNDAGKVVVRQVPELRIVDDRLWQAVQARLVQQSAKNDRDETSNTTRPPFWEQRRPVHLLSGKVICGTCGKPFMNVGRDYLACRVAEAHGPCDNRSRVRRPRLEAEILVALEQRLMRPELVAEFVSTFTAEWNSLRAEASAGLGAKRRELDSVERKLAGLIEAIADGLRASGLQGRLDDLEARRQALQAEIRAIEIGSEMPRLHANLAEVYRDRVTHLREAFEAGGGPEVLEAARVLIDRVEVHAPAEPGAEPRIELIGHLAAMLRTAGAFEAEGAHRPAGQAPRPARAAKAKSPPADADGLDVFLGSVKVDAGTRNRRCQYATVAI
jgi:DNA invertase Pin-like site-specific DNA recombinase